MINNSLGNINSEERNLNSQSYNTNDPLELERMEEESNIKSGKNLYTSKFK